ncbi:unnamed protein product [Closterium sp. NIES-65]|nr:unnamed protein product [Closterium sp. NIES-65]
MTGKKKHSSSVFRIVRGFGAALLLVLVLKPIVPCLWSREPGICPILEVPSLARREIKEAAEAGKLESRVSVSESASSVSETVKSDAGKMEEQQVADAAAAENGRELAAAKLALSAELDSPINADNLSSQRRSSGVEEAEEEESMTSAVESMSEDDKERDVKSLWRCQGGSGAVDCAEPQALLLAEGALAQRVHAVCAAYALTALTGAPTLAVWPADRHLPATTFRHLFRPASSMATPPGDVADSAVSGEARDVWVHDVRMPSGDLTARLHTSQQVMLKECPRGSRRKTKRTPLPFRRYLSPSAQSQASGALNLDGCAYDKHVDACLGRLRPSTAVGALVMQEDLDALKLSKAIYVSVSPHARSAWHGTLSRTVHGCAALHGCPPARQPISPTMRHAPRHHGLPPFPPFHYQKPPAGAPCSGCPRMANSSAPLCAMRRITMAFLHDPHVAFALAARAAPDVTAVGDFFSELRRPLVLKASQSRLDTCQEGGRRELAEGKGVLGSEVGGTSIKCAQLQAAELFALSFARALVPIHRWAIEPRFILAQGARRSPAFQVLPSICETERLPPIIRHRWSWFTQVEEKLKLVVCTMPKVAANSWLMWLRAKLGQPNPNDPILALDVDKAGWHLLGRHFTEKEAVRLVTRPDFFRFTFVRNPFSRALSAYSNKLVVTDTPNNKTGPGSREYWNERFFRFVRPQFELLKGEDDLVSFPDFMRLVALMKKNFRWKMDRHIAPQVDVCFMQMIKYDFVGRFESLEEDAKYVVNRFGGDHLDIFNFGVNAHQTRADTKLVKKYTKDAYELVKEVYAQDFFIPLNNITQTAPPVLSQIFEG